jgi:hypothetical protein
MALGSTQPLAEMSTRNIPRGDNLTAIYEPIIWKIWEPRRLTTLWTSTVCFTFFYWFSRPNANYEVGTGKERGKQTHTNKQTTKQCNVYQSDNSDSSVHHYAVRIYTYTHLHLSYSVTKKYIYEIWLWETVLAPNTSTPLRTTLPAETHLEGGQLLLEERILHVENCLIYKQKHEGQQFPNNNNSIQFN